MRIANRHEERDGRVMNTPQHRRLPLQQRSPQPPANADPFGPVAANPIMTLAQLQHARAALQQPAHQPLPHALPAHPLPPGQLPPAPAVMTIEQLRQAHQNLPPLRAPLRARAPHHPHPAPAPAPGPAPALPPVPIPIPAPVPAPALAAVPAPAPQHPAQRTVRQWRRRQANMLLIARQPYIEVDHELHYLGRMEVICPNCGALHWMDERLSKSSQINPKFGSCCLSGKVKIPTLRDPPRELMELLTGDDPLSRGFRNNIRKYNSAIAFTSVGAKLDDSLNGPQRGANGQGAPWVFRLQGQMVHRIGALEAAPGQTPQYAHLLFVDAEQALQTRMRHPANQSLQEDVMRTLQMMLEEHNPYVPLYRQAREILIQQERLNPGATDLHLRLEFKSNSAYDPRTYHLPTADEVAAIIPDGPTNEGSHRDIVLRLRNNQLQRISELHRLYFPLAYPLLFPYGKFGWTIGLPWNLVDPAPPVEEPELPQARDAEEEEVLTIMLRIRMNERHAVADSFHSKSTIITSTSWRSPNLISWWTPLPAIYR